MGATTNQSIQNEEVESKAGVRKLEGIHQTTNCVKLTLVIEPYFHSNILVQNDQNVTYVRVRLKCFIDCVKIINLTCVYICNLLFGHPGSLSYKYTIKSYLL